VQPTLGLRFPTLQFLSGVDDPTLEGRRGGMRECVELVLWALQGLPLGTEGWRVCHANPWTVRRGGHARERRAVRAYAPPWPAPGHGDLAGLLVRQVQ
jgi:hypothetical protein